MIVSQTPLRISLCGGGTDFKDYYEKEEGFVISTAIDKFVYVIVKERFDEKIYVDYAKKEIVDSVDEIKHDLVREAALKAGVTNGFEVAMLADIPSEGSGLGSSSSLTVGLLNAFYSFQGTQVTPEQLAREACEIEIDILGKPIGKQDQYIAAYGGLTGIRFRKDGSVRIEKVKIGGEMKRRLGGNLLLFFTNTTRQASTILAEQKANIKDTLNSLNTIKQLAFDAVTALERGDIDQIGYILEKNWDLKKTLSSNISNDYIDRMYNQAIEGGALGAKIAGAGGGGFLMAYCPRMSQDIMRGKMSEYREFPFLLEPFGTRILFNYRRYDWK
jgi:D-glycero-alpha-D-manno-heptose-7-phosphate kinase